MATPLKNRKDLSDRILRLKKRYPEASKSQVIYELNSLDINGNLIGIPPNSPPETFYYLEYLELEFSLLYSDMFFPAVRI